MKKIERIDPFLKELRKIWRANPDLRFGQLIMNSAFNSNSIYYAEEEDLLEAMHITYGSPIKNVIIIGAAGRDFHNFNVYFKDNSDYNVVAFTAAQIPGISDKMYPAELAGDMYPEGIPIYHEDLLDEIIVEHNVELCVFAYSDVTYDHIENIRNLVELYGAELITLSPEQTQLKSTKPVISVTATRTGCGKSSVSLKIAKILTEAGLKVGVIRHPMPYDDDLRLQKVQNFSMIGDMDSCTIEEREEYEPYVDAGMKIWAGIDYEEILRQAEAESDIILWDGGNNDFSFIKPDLSIVVADPLRVGDELEYYPSDINIKGADYVIINKCNSATIKQINKLEFNIKLLNLDCQIIYTDSVVTVDDPELIEGKDVCVIEDGPTLTHGGMGYGAGYVAAKKYNCDIVSPHRKAVGTIKETYDKYEHLFTVLPAMGYNNKQLIDLEDTINAISCDAVLIATPINLGALIHINKPHIRVHYDIKELGYTLKEIIDNFMR